MRPMSSIEVQVCQCPPCRAVARAAPGLVPGACTASPVVTTAVPPVAMSATTATSASSAPPPVGAAEIATVIPGAAAGSPSDQTGPRLLAAPPRAPLDTAETGGLVLA